jgi:thiol-disulfide isomerase/thioredoxin
VAWLPAMVAVALLAGCAKKDPVTASTSKLRPASAKDKDDDNKSPPKDDDQLAIEDDANSPNSNGQRPTVTDKNQPDTVKKPPTTPPRDALYTVPEGGPDKLIPYLDKLDKRLQDLVEQLNNTGGQLSEEAGNVVLSDLKQLMQSRMTAADRILASDEAEGEARLRAVESKLDALGFLEQTGDKTAAGKIDAFIATLEDDTNEEVRRIALGHTLTAEIEKIGRGEEEDATKLLAQLKTLLVPGAKNLSPEHFTTARAAAIVLLQNQQVDAGVEVMKLMGEAFAASDDPDMQEAAKSMTEQAQAISLQHAAEQFKAGDEKARDRLLAIAKAATEPDAVQVQPLMVLTQVSSELKAEHPDVSQELLALSATGLQNLVEKKDQDLSVLVMVTRLAKMTDPPNADLIAKANEQIVARVQKDVAAEGVTTDTLMQLLSDVAMRAEFSGEVQLASQLYDAIGAAAAKIEDQKSVETINEQLEAARKRVGLIGKPLVVEGKLLDGSKFDWAPYAGKVVLVDFWATWCGPCIAEIPNIKTNYDNYHEQGFDVIGVNIDDDNATVLDYFKARGELPWTTVVSPDDAARGFDTPLAKASGVTAIPFVVLVGKDGNVEAIHVRGEELGKQLEKIFGPPMNKDEVPDAVPEVNEVPDDPTSEPPAADEKEDAAPAADAVPQ